MANVEMIVHDNAANMLGTRLENFNLIFVRGEIGFFYLEYSIYSNMPKTLLDNCNYFLYCKAVIIFSSLACRSIQCCGLP